MAVSSLLLIDVDGLRPGVFSAGGYYFAAPMRGMHGGLHPEDSFATLAFGMPGVTELEWQAAQATMQQAIQTRCQAEHDRQPSTADLLTGLMALI